MVPLNHYLILSGLLFSIGTAGVFGAPTFFVADEMFFGNDRLPLVKAALEAVSCLGTAMWTPADRALVGGFGSGQALTDDQFRLLEPLIPPAKPGGRPRTTAAWRGLPICTMNCGQTSMVLGSRPAFSASSCRVFTPARRRSTCMPAGSQPSPHAAMRRKDDADLHVASLGLSAP